MRIKQHATTDRTYHHAVAARIDAARALHSAEIAVHDAHQTHVDQWISAANDRLHIAVAQYLAADALLSALSAQTLAPSPHRHRSSLIRRRHETGDLPVIALADASHGLGHAGASHLQDVLEQQ